VNDKILANRQAFACCMSSPACVDAAICLSVCFPFVFLVFLLFNVCISLRIERERERERPYYCDLPTCAVPVSSSVQNADLRIHTAQEEE